MEIKVDNRGGYRPGAGSKPGQKKKKTLEWEAFGKTVLDKGMPRFIKIMQDTNDEEFAKIFLQILEYFKPKLARTEIKNPDGETFELKITKEIVHTKTDGTQDK